MFNQGMKHLKNGEYSEAETIFDEILEMHPNNISTLKIKGITLINQEHYPNALKHFFKVLQYKPNDVTALVGMGVGMGYLGEYKEAQSYFERANELKPDNLMIQNYLQYAIKVNEKYPYTPTEKPKELLQINIEIPKWVKNISQWWALDEISDNEFSASLKYLIEQKILEIPLVITEKSNGDSIPLWVKNNAKWWAEGSIDDSTFVQGIQYLIRNGSIVINTSDIPEKSQKEIDNEYYQFGRYLRSIENNISKEIRYIEFPNPSLDVIKKFLRDYVKWNYEAEVQKASTSFPDPTYEIIDEEYVIYYKVYINEQPMGLPLDHVSTLVNSFEFWENQSLSTNNQKAKIKFEVTEKKHEANVWITWVVRDIGQGVLGHAHLGKGVVEVTLGDYNCDGSFQLYDVNSVETIMTHELGHSIGLKHVEEKTNIMYPSYSPSYAYCMLS
ncbi:MAG: M57 family metalloprotease [Nitrosopumilus sp.]